jgi:hypothetical protein
VCRKFSCAQGKSLKGASYGGTAEGWEADTKEKKGKVNKEYARKDIFESAMQKGEC